MYFYFAWKMSMNAITRNAVRQGQCSCNWSLNSGILLFSSRKQTFQDGLWADSSSFCAGFRLWLWSALAAFAVLVILAVAHTPPGGCQDLLGFLFDQNIYLIACLDKWAKLCHSRHSPTHLHPALSNTDPHLELGSCWMFLLPFKFLKKTKRCPQTLGHCRKGDSRVICSPVAPGIHHCGVRYLRASGNEKMSFLKDVINCYFNLTHAGWRTEMSP